MTNNKFDSFAITAANYEALTPLSFLPRTALMFPDRRAVVYGERSYRGKNSISAAQSSPQHLTRLVSAKAILSLFWRQIHPK